MTARLKLLKFQERARALHDALRLRDDLALTEEQCQEFLERHARLVEALSRDLAEDAQRWYDRLVELERLHTWWCGMGGAAPRPGGLPQWYPSGDWDEFMDPPVSDESTDIIMSPSADTVIPLERVPEEIRDPLIQPVWWPKEDPDPSRTPPPTPSAGLRKST